MVDEKHKPVEPNTLLHPVGHKLYIVDRVSRLQIVRSHVSIVDSGNY